MRAGPRGRGVAARLLRVPGGPRLSGHQPRLREAGRRLAPAPVALPGPLRAGRGIAEGRRPVSHHQPRRHGQGQRRWPPGLGASADRARRAHHRRDEGQPAQDCVAGRPRSPGPRRRLSLHVHRQRGPRHHPHTCSSGVGDSDGFPQRTVPRRHRHRADPHHHPPCPAAAGAASGVRLAAFSEEDLASGGASAAVRGAVARAAAGAGAGHPGLRVRQAVLRAADGGGAGGREDGSRRGGRSRAGGQLLLDAG